MAVITIVVTGGAGFIGSAFVRRAIASNWARVVVIDKLAYSGSRASLPAVDSQVTFIQADIADRNLVSQVLNEHVPSAIINFAAESHVDRSIDEPLQFVHTNVLGTCELLQSTLKYWRGLSAAARGEFRFLQVSTDEVYGSLSGNGRFTELTPYSPNSPYAASKAAADHFVRAFHQTYGLPTFVTNCSNNYGPFQFPEKLIPLMILNALQGNDLPVYGDGLHVRDWLHVEDHCRALWLVLRQGAAGTSYNIGANCELPNIQVVNMICDLVDEFVPGLSHSPCRRLIRYVSDRPGHDRRYAIDSSKIRSELGWSPLIQFEDGLRNTVKWYLDNPGWVKHFAPHEFDRRRGLA